MIGIAKKKTNEGISSYLGINDQAFGNLMIGEHAESLCHPWMFAAFVYPKALKLGHSQNKGPKLMNMCSLAFCECLPLVSPLVKQAINHELRHS